METLVATDTIPWDEEVEILFEPWALVTGGVVDVVWWGSTVRLPWIMEVCR